MPRDYITTPIEVRFERKVDRSGGPDACHLWTGSTAKMGYGQLAGARTEVNVRVRPVSAHVLAWTLANNRAPLPKEVVRHTCDVKACVNPKHLIIGTHKDNTADAINRGRYRNGLKTNLTWETVSEIRTKYDAGAKINVLAQKYGVSPSCIYDIVSGKTWKPTDFHAPPGARLFKYNPGRQKKLTADQVREIRILCAKGETRVAVGFKFGIAAGNVTQIVDRKTWKWVN